MRWQRVQDEEQEAGPGGRFGHSCNSVREGTEIYVFGGFGGDRNLESNQVYVFDTATYTWSQPTITGLKPVPRSEHSCTTVGDNLYIFGGNDGSGDGLGDLHILNTVSHTWTSPSVSGDIPEARAGHGAALFGTRLFVFGGWNSSSYYNNVYALDTETLRWKHEVTSGNPPCARCGHTCSSWNSTMIVIGGANEKREFLSDVHVLDAETLAWTELTTTGQKLPPIVDHSTIALGKHLLVFGGYFKAPLDKIQNSDVYMLDVEKALWSKVDTTGNVPIARHSTSGVCLDSADFSMVAFYGGLTNTMDEYLGDMCYLHTGLSGEIVDRGNTRKRAGAEVGVVMSDDECDSKPKVARTDNSEEDATNLDPLLNVNADVSALGEDRNEMDKDQDSACS